MASSTSSLFPASPSSCQIAARPTSASINPHGLSVSAVRIRSWRRFAAAGNEVSLVPARRIRPPPRRRNALRETASPLLVKHQVCPPPYDKPPESHSETSKNCSLVGGAGNFWSGEEPKSGSLDLDEELEISGGLDAVESGNVAMDSNLDGEKNVLRVAEEESCFCGTGAGPVFTVYEDPEGNVVNVEVDEDEIISRSETAGGEESGELQLMLSRARAMAKEVENGKRVVPRNRSLFQFVKVGWKELPVVNAEISVVQRNQTPLRGVAWGCFAALGGLCVVLVASKLSRRDGKTQLPREAFAMLRPEKKDGELDKGIIKVLSTVQKFPGDLSGRPQLDRSELMNNIKRAKELRERFVLRNVFSCNTVANDYDANMTEIRRMVTYVHVLEEGILEQSNTDKNNCFAFPYPVAAIEEEVSASNGRQPEYLDDVSESSEFPDTSLLNDIVEESVEQSVDLKNGGPVIDISVKNQNNVGEIELPEPTPYDERTTDAKDRTSVVYTAEKEAHICSADDHNVGPNSVNTPSSEFERKEQYSEIGVKNLDCIHGIKSYVPFSTDKQAIYTKDNAHQISINVVSETADDLSCCHFNISSSELKNNETPVDMSVNDLNHIQEIKVDRSFANDAQTAHCKELAHSVSIMGKEACKNPVMDGILTTKSPQRIWEVPVDLMRDNVQSMQEPEPSNSTGDDKQIIHANEEDHKISTLHNETQTSLEMDNTGTLDDASTSSLHALQEEKVQHKGAKISTSEKQEKGTSSNKEDRACLKKKKGKLQKEVCSDKEPKTKLSAQGVPGTSTVVGPSNGVHKAKRVAQKRLKKVQSDEGVTERVVAQYDVQSSSMVGQKTKSQNAKRTRRKNLKDAFRNQGAQTREKIPEIALMANSPDNATRVENMKPLGGAGSSTETQSTKNTFREAPNEFIVSTMRKEGLKLNFETLERVEEAAVETNTNMHGDNVMHERSIDFNKSKMGVTAAKKSTKRKSLSKRTKSSYSVSNKDSKGTH